MELLKAANARAASHGDVISLCAGQPSTPAPAPVRRAAADALTAGAVLGYTDTIGTLPLRAAIAQHYRATYRLDVDPDQVVVTTGSSAAFTALFLAAFDPGDVVVMARPGYPAYRNTAQALGCVVVELDAGPQVRYQPTLAMLQEYAAACGPPAGLMLASPANPTGTVLQDTELAAIARWCAEHGVLLVSDEIYHGITYGRHAACAWETTRAGAVVGSFSKFFSMTGWRVGWALVPEPLLRPVELLLGNLNICAPALCQLGAVAAFDPDSLDELRGHVRRYAVNRDHVLARLPELGVTEVAPPDGAFYAYADVSHLTTDSQAWCAQVLDATGVALTPGIDFAPGRPGRPTDQDGTRFARLSFAGGTEAIDEAFDRLVAYLNR